MPPPVLPGGNTWNAFGWSAVIISTATTDPDAEDVVKNSFVVIGEPGREIDDPTMSSETGGAVYIYKSVEPVVEPEED